MKERIFNDVARLVQRGAIAKEVLQYADEFISKEIDNLIDRAKNPSEREALALWTELQVLRRFQRRIRADIESGDAAAKLRKKEKADG